MAAFAIFPLLTARSAIFAVDTAKSAIFAVLTARLAKETIQLMATSPSRTYKPARTSSSFLVVQSVKMALITAARKYNNGRVSLSFPASLNARDSTRQITVTAMEMMEAKSITIPPSGLLSHFISWEGDL